MYLDAIIHAKNISSAVNSNSFPLLVILIIYAYSLQNEKMSLCLLFPNLF